MEDKGGFLSRIFRKKKETPVTNTAPLSQEQPIQTTPPLPSGAEERKKILKKRGQEQAQGGYENLVKDVQTGLSPQSPPGTGSEQIKKESEKVAMTQTLNKAARVQDKLAPKGTASERFKRLTQNPPRPDLPTNIIQQKPVENMIPPAQVSAQPLSQKKTEPTLSERKTKEINPEKLNKSLRTSPSEWGRETKPATPPQEPVKKNESVAPFPTGTFPGVDKWQPGKGAIKGETLKKVIKEVKEMPENAFEENIPEIEQNKPAPAPTITPTPIMQEKAKEPA